MRGLSYILLMISCLFFAKTAQCQVVRDSVRIYFLQGSSMLDFSIGNNQAELTRIADRMSTYQADSIYQLKNITVIGGASPESGIHLNERLSESRANVLLDYLSHYVALSADNTNLVCLGRDWQGLLNLVKADDMVPYRDEVIALIYDIITKQDNETHISQDGYDRLVNLRNGEPHRYLYREFFPELRAATCICVWKKVPKYVESLQMIGSRIYRITSPCKEVSLRWPYPHDETIQLPRIPVVAVRTNLLVPGFNLGVEVPIGNTWSVGADYYFPWLSRKEDNRNAMQLLSWGLSGRYWPGQDRTYMDRLLGHSVGLGAYGGYYDLERDFAGHQGEYVSVYLDYMYAMPVFRKKMHLEFTLGLGYLYSKARPYDVFEPGGKAFNKGYTKNIHWFGPVKVGISLVVPICTTIKKTAV